MCATVPPNLFVQAESGGGGNRTRVVVPVKPCEGLHYTPGWNNLAELGQLTELRRHIIARDGEGCFYCGADVGRLQLDHVVPSARGGSDHVDNIVQACAPCNTRKNTWPGWIFILDRAVPGFATDIRNRRLKAYA